MTDFTLRSSSSCLKLGIEARAGAPSRCAIPGHKREHWNGPPRRHGKAEALRKLLERMSRQNERDLRAFMAEARRRTA